MMKYNQKLGIIDISIQGIFLVLLIISALSIFAEEMAVVFVLIVQFFLGIYQLSSGIIGAAKGRRWKVYYLIGSIIYLIGGGVGIGILGDAAWRSGTSFYFMIFLGIVAPVLIGLTYFILTFIEYKKSKSDQPKEDLDILDELLEENV